MSAPALDELLEVAVRAARRGGEELTRCFGASDLQVEEKARNDFVSSADRASEEAIIGEIRASFPSHRILAEESGGHDGEGGTELEWVLDPLDGTTNFLRCLPVFCVSVACRRRGEELIAVVLDPTRDDVFTATSGGGARRNGEPIRVASGARLDGAVLATGFPFKAHPALDVYLSLFRDLFLQARAIRRCGAAALDLAYTAAGVYDGFFEFRLAPWDLAAGCLLVREAGGVVSDLDGGDDYLASGNVLAAGPALHGDLRTVVKHHTSEAAMDALVPRSR